MVGCAADDDSATLATGTAAIATTDDILFQDDFDRSTLPGWQVNAFVPGNFDDQECGSEQHGDSRAVVGRVFAPGFDVRFLTCQLARTATWDWSDVEAPVLELVADGSALADAPDPAHRAWVVVGVQEDHQLEWTQRIPAGDPEAMVFDLAELAGESEVTLTLSLDIKTCVEGGESTECAPGGPDAEAWFDDLVVRDAS